MNATPPDIAGKTPVEVDLEEGKTYFFCTCGKSEKQPFCDGAHKGTEFKSLSFTAEKTGKAWLCMCKQTGRSPFCDGTHSKL
jgi:CDGSH-type Zn-finger protein